MFTNGIPTIDPAVKYVGVSKLRELNAAKLRASSETTYVLQDNDKPLAVLISYDTYLLIQQQLHHGQVNTLEMLTTDEEREGVSRGLQDAAAGRVRPFSEIKAELRRKHAAAKSEE